MRPGRGSRGWQSLPGGRVSGTSHPLISSLPSQRPPSACLPPAPLIPWQTALKGIPVVDAQSDAFYGASLRNALAGSMALAGEAGTPGRLRVGVLRRLIGEATLLSHCCRSWVVSGLGCWGVAGRLQREQAVQGPTVSLPATHAQLGSLSGGAAPCSAAPLRLSCSALSPSPPSTPAAQGGGVAGAAAGRDCAPLLWLSRRRAAHRCAAQRRCGALGSLCGHNGPAGPCSTRHCASAWAAVGPRRSAAACKQAG